MKILNALGGDRWRPRYFMIDTVSDTTVRVHGMVRGPFGVTPDFPDADDRTMPIGITWLPLGMLIAECPNGAKAMHAADAVMVRHPGLFSTWPPDGLAIQAALPALDALFGELRCKMHLEVG